MCGVDADFCWLKFLGASHKVKGRVGFEILIVCIGLIIIP